MQRTQLKIPLLHFTNLLYILLFAPILIPKQWILSTRAINLVAICAISCSSLFSKCTHIRRSCCVENCESVDFCLVDVANKYDDGTTDDHSVIMRAMQSPQLNLHSFPILLTLISYLFSHLFHFPSDTFWQYF